MTIWCDSCQSHCSLPCPLHQGSAGDSSSRAACKRSRSARSTKGASKVRRDHINGEIRSMRALLPIPREEQEHLSYLHAMAAICTYVRKSVLLPGVLGVQGRGSSVPPYETFLPALPGFILVVSTRGSLVYVSENVSEYLGHSMVDVLQGDTVYDMIESADVDAVKAQLEADNCQLPDRTFTCCMHASKAFRLRHQGQPCSMLVRGRFQSSSASAASSSSSTETGAGSLGDRRLFVALCTPTVDRWHGDEAASLAPRFGSVHRPDMSFAHTSDSVFYYLGYTVEEMYGRSWYGLLHPEDLQRAANAHKSLVQEHEDREVEMVSRLQHKQLSWTWIYTRAAGHWDSQSIHCTNYIISESEASYLVEKINRSNTAGPSLAAAEPAPPCALQMPPRPWSDGLANCFKRQRRSDGQRAEESSSAAKTRRTEGREGERDVYRVACVSSSSSSSYSLPLVADGLPPVAVGDSALLFTPPYSPAPSDCSLQAEEAGCDFLMDLRGYADLSPSSSSSSPESESPSYYPYLNNGGVPVTHPSPYHSPHTDLCLSPSYGPVPDCLSVPDLLLGAGSPGDCCTLDPEEFALLQPPPQGGSDFQSHHVPHGSTAVELSLHPSLLTPSPSPTSLDSSFQYNDRDHVEISILAQQISSLANSFDLYGGPGRVQSSPIALPAAGVPLPPCDWPKILALPTAAAAPAAAAALPFKPELVLDDSVIDSILKELDAVVEDSGEAGVLACAGALTDCQGSQRGHPCVIALPLHNTTGTTGTAAAPPTPTSTAADPRPAVEQFAAADRASVEPFALQLGSHEEIPGLHQLDRYIHRSLQQQDGLLEEALY